MANIGIESGTHSQEVNLTAVDIMHNLVLDWSTKIRNLGGIVYNSRPVQELIVEIDEIKYDLHQQAGSPPRPLE